MRPWTRSPQIQRRAREEGARVRPAWPMIVLRTPKGWTGPAEVDGVPVEGTYRAHQVPLAGLAEKPEHLRMLEEWMRSYGPRELFDEGGTPIREITDLAPAGERRMSASPHANGGLLLRPLTMPDFRAYEVDVRTPGAADAEATRVLGGFLRDVMRANGETRNFRLFGPDETASNRLDAVYEVTDKAWEAEITPLDEHLAPGGRVMEVLSEHQCQGWLEGYLLTGRHGLFSCYEAFIHIVDSMVNQHAKWLKVTRQLAWRRPIGSLNYLLTSHVWRQDHNGFSHQDPGFIDHLVNKKAEIVRVYLPPDANTLLSTADHCLRSRDYINLVVAGKQPAPQWLTMEEAVAHCTRGLGIWEWASTDSGATPDVVMACCGDVPTLETLAAAALVRELLPGAARAGRQRGRPHAPGGAHPAPPRPAGRRVRRPLHGRPPGDLRLPRLPVADPPAHLQARQPPQHARARLHGGGHDDDALRHGDAQRPRPVPPGDGRDRPRAGARRDGGGPAPAHGRPAPARARLHARARRGPPRRHRVAVVAGAGRVTAT